MKELQKILKEIDELITEYMDGDVPLGMQDFCAGMKKSQEIICNHMNDGWIPVEERLPEEGEECLAQFEVKVRNTRNEVIKATYIHVLYLEGGIWKKLRRNTKWKSHRLASSSRAVQRITKLPFGTEKGRDR